VRVAGTQPGAALGCDPAAARVLPLLDGRDGCELVTTIAGGMRLADYLPIRTFELAVHTADLATALKDPPHNGTEGRVRTALPARTCGPNLWDTTHRLAVLATR